MVSVTDLEDVFSKARRHGFAVAPISVEAAASGIEIAGVAIPTRPGGPAIGVIEPRTEGEAHPRSLSASYGLRALPLHTDGAHLRRPPDFTLLEAGEGTVKPTLLFDLRTATLPTGVEHALRNGVFAVGRGPSTFYANAREAEGDVRYDPACMFPIDPDARIVRSWLSDAAGSAREHRWEPGMTLVIANLRCLHGRPDVSGNPDRVLRRLMVHWNP